MQIDNGGYAPSAAAKCKKLHKFERIFLLNAQRMKMQDKRVEFSTFLVDISAAAVLHWSDRNEDGIY